MNASVQRMNLTTANKIIKAKEEHGTTRTTSVNIRETPMQRTVTKLLKQRKNTEQHGQRP